MLLTDLPRRYANVDLNLALDGWPKTRLCRPTPRSGKPTPHIARKALYLGNVALAAA